MTAAVARAATAADHGLLAGYARALQALGPAATGRCATGCVSPGTSSTAIPICRRGWRLPTAGRVTELQTHGRVAAGGATLIGTGQLRLDLELAGAKHLTGLGPHRRGPRSAGVRGGPGRRAGDWAGQPAWVETVLGECLAVLLAWHGGHGRRPEPAEVVDAFDAELAACMTIPRSSRRAYRNRLAGLRQLLFEIRVIDTPPRRRPWARTLEQRFADVRDGRPGSGGCCCVTSRPGPRCCARSRWSRLVNDLLPFARVPHRPPPRRHQPAAAANAATSRVPGLEPHPALARPARSRRAGRAISAAVAQSAVLSLRNMLDDIAAWGWAEAPSRRLVFAADVPKLDRPLPRALPPDVDAAS